MCGKKLEYLVYRHLKWTVIDFGPCQDWLNHLLDWIYLFKSAFSNNDPILVKEWKYKNSISIIGYPNFWSTSKLPPVMVDDACLESAPPPPGGSIYGAYQPHQFVEKEQTRGMYHQVPTPQGGIPSKSGKQKILHLKPSHSAQQMTQFTTAQTPSGSGRVPPSSLPLQVFEQANVMVNMQQEPTGVSTKDAKKGWAANNVVHLYSHYTHYYYSLYYYYSTNVNKSIVDYNLESIGNGGTALLMMKNENGSHIFL